MSIPTWRRLLAQGLLAAPGVYFMVDGAFRSWAPPAILFGGLLVGGAALLGRKGVVSQVLGRGAAWALFGTATLGALAELLLSQSTPELAVFAVAGAAGGALALARPMLDTEEAKAAFAPVACRTGFLAACYAAVAHASLLATIGLAIGWQYGYELSWVGLTLGLPLLVGSLVASAVGVARMRAWGILLGAVTSVLALGVGATSHDDALRVLLACSALPGVMMGGALLVARAKGKARASSREGTRARIAYRPEAEAPALRLRIEAPEEIDGEVVEPAGPQARVRA